MSNLLLKFRLIILFYYQFFLYIQQARVAQMNPLLGIKRFAAIWFGDFSKAELKKYSLLGIVYGIIIGVYWTLRVVKDSAFMCMVGQSYLYYAKTASLLILLPVVLMYSKMIVFLPRHRMLYALIALYSVLALLFGFLFLHPTLGLANTQAGVGRILAWAWYVFVESYGSLVPALFWAFATDITDPNAARRGFPLVVMIAQSLSCLGPLLLTPLASARWFGSSAYVVLAAALVLAFALIIVKIFMTVVPKEQLVGYRPAHAIAVEDKLHHKKIGFWSGLRLLLSQPYLLGIFLVVAVYEAIMALIDFNFKNKVGEVTSGESACTLYLGSYALWVNLISSLCLIFGASNIQRRLGLRVSLLVMPVIIGVAVFAFTLYPVEHVFFWIMVGAKGLNYAINSPSVKQLYVPTTVAVKYQSQTWIDTFGSRGAKAIGSLFNAIRSPLTHMFGAQMAIGLYRGLSAGFSGVLLLVWFFVALYLGRRYNKAVDKKEVVC